MYKSVSSLTYWTYTSTLSSLSSFFFTRHLSSVMSLWCLLFYCFLPWLFGETLLESLLGFLFQLRLCASRRISFPLFIFRLSKSKITEKPKSWQESLYIQASRRWNMSHLWFDGSFIASGFMWRKSSWLLLKQRRLYFFYSDNSRLRSLHSSFAY